jgi:ankyrin repeat protein
MAASSSENSSAVANVDTNVPRYWYLPVFTPLKQKLKSDERKGFDNFLLVLIEEFDCFFEEKIFQSSLEFVYGLIDKSFLYFGKYEDESLPMKTFASDMFFIALILTWHASDVALEKQDMRYFIDSFNKLENFHESYFPDTEREINQSRRALIARGFAMAKDAFDYQLRVTNREQVETRMKEQGVLPILIHSLKTLPDGGLCDAVKRNDFDAVKKFYLLYWNALDCDKNGQSALSIAISNGYTSIVELLLTTIDKDQILPREKVTSIFLAAAQGQLDIVKTLITLGANCDKPDGAGTTPLMIAAINQHKEVVKLLLSAGADFTLSEETNGRMLFHMAASNGYQDIIEQLLAAGVNIDVAARSGKTALIYALQSGHHQLADWLIEQGASKTVVASDGTTLLHAAAEGGNDVYAEQLLASGLDVNQPGKQGHTPLLLAAIQGHAKTVTRLLQAGAKINDINDAKMTPLDVATYNGHLEVVQVLSKADEQISQKLHSSNSPLFFAIQKNHIELVNFFIEIGCDINAVSGMSERDLYKEVVNALRDTGANTRRMTQRALSPLCVAIYMGHVEIVERLLQAGAEKSINDDNGYVLLLLAIEKRHYKIITLLLASGVRINPTEEDRAVPLHKAITQRSQSIVTMLLDAGADLNKKDYRYITPLYVAAKCGVTAIARQLIARGANINDLCTEEDATPLHVAALEGHHKVVDLLLSAGAMIEATTRRGETPLFWAVKGGKAPAIVKWLIAAKANTQLIDYLGNTLLIQAARANNPHIFAILLKTDLGRNVNRANKTGITPLHIAADKGNKLIVQQLLAAKVNKHASLASGETPIFFALNKKYKKIVDMLREEPQQPSHRRRLSR